MKNNKLEPGTWKDTQQSRARHWLRILFRYWFRVELRGSYQPTSDAVIISNRTSAIDLILLAVFLPTRLTLVLSTANAGRFWSKIMGLVADIVVIDPANAFAARTLINAIRAKKGCFVLSLGSDARDGGTKVFDAPALILQKTGAAVIPVRIEGGQYSIFSYTKDKHLCRLFPKIIVHMLPAVTYVEQQPVDRQTLSIRLFRLLSELSFSNNFQPMPLFKALIQGVVLGTHNKAKIEDANRTPISFKQFLARCFILGRQMKNQTQAGEHVGLLLPTTVAGMVSFFALHAYRRIPAMLNFSLGFSSLLSTCKVAGINTIYTARQFVATAKLDEVVANLQQAGITVYFLEDFKVSIKLSHKLSGLLKGAFPSWAYHVIGKPVAAKEPGVILFTSGSEGVAKGVVLSHANLLGNCAQLMARVDFSHQDKFFDALPIFHCFGLTAGALLPLTQGINCFFYPSPLHYKIIPGLVYQTGATIMLSTDTFLTGYARVAASHDFASIRYIFAGAEKVKLETMRYWQDVFGVTVYAGYGATEAAPVISMNCPLAFSAASVGMLLPAMEHKIQPVDGIAQGGRLLIRGPNIMMGYLSATAPGTIIAAENGWHDTGDIVTMNEDQFITIAGRAKRFAKIAGEMISLTAVEGVAASIWPELLHAAVSKPCQRKGEQILLFSEANQADKTAFIKKIKELSCSELLIPQQIISGSKIPIMASGKIDYMAIEKNMEVAVI